MKIIYYPNPSGSRYWRLEHPFKYLKQKHGFEINVGVNGITEKDAIENDVFVLQSCVDKSGIALLYAYQQEMGKKIVVDVDDYLEVDKDNPHKIEHDRANAAEIIKQTLKIADMVTTTTPYLANYLKKFNDNVVILPNYMDLEYWDGEITKNESNEIRVGYVGSMTHYKDLQLIRQSLIDVMIDHPEVKLILVGDMRYRDLFEGFNVEVHLGVPFEDYSNKLRNLRLDIGIAPLQENEFNKYKSPIKAFEYGICEVPVIASRTKFYKDFIDDNVNGYLANRYIDWWSPLESLVVNPIKRRRMGKALKEKVLKECNLANQIHLWETAYNGLSI